MMEHVSGLTDKKVQSSPSCVPEEVNWKTRATSNVPFRDERAFTNCIR